MPNPTVAFDRPLRVRLRLDSGRFRLALGIRETGTSAEIGDNGGTSGTIEWIGVNSDRDGAPQGMLVTPMPGVWQTFIFQPASDSVHGMTGDGILWTQTNKGVLEHLAFSVVDTVGPFTVYIDDIDVLCALPSFGDLDHDGDVSVADHALFAPCVSGPAASPSGDCGEADANDDNRVDLFDFAAFQREFTGLR